MFYDFVFKFRSALGLNNDQIRQKMKKSVIQLAFFNSFLHGTANTQNIGSTTNQYHIWIVPIGVKSEIWKWILTLEALGVGSGNEN